MQTTEQTDMAQKLLNDDESVLEDVLRMLGPAVMTVMKRRYIGALNETDIEDVISIGLYRLWTARERFDSKRGSLHVWFFQIVENAARDVLRLGWHKARQMEVRDEYDLISPPPRNGNAAINLFGRNNRSPPATSLQVDLKDIIEDLPDAQRRIITADAMAKDDVASSQWLSEELDMNPSTIRVYRKRAMDRIRKELQQRGRANAY